MKPHEEIVPFFFAVWVILGVGSALFFHFNRDAQLKKRLMPFFIIGTGVLFALFVLIMTGQPRILLFLVPAVALISWMNLRIINVCNACGRTVYNNVWFSKAEYCSKCGAKLQP
jgi:hypothetical protein